MGGPFWGGSFQFLGLGLWGSRGFFKGSIRHPRGLGVGARFGGFLLILGFRVMGFKTIRHL